MIFLKKLRKPIDSSSFILKHYHTGPFRVISVILFLFCLVLLSYHYISYEGTSNKFITIFKVSPSPIVVHEFVRKAPPVEEVVTNSSRKGVPKAPPIEESVSIAPPVEVVEEKASPVDEIVTIVPPPPPPPVDEVVIRPSSIQDDEKKAKVKAKIGHNQAKKDPCSGRYIYIHKLPRRFNQQLIKNCRALDKWFDYCPYVKNGGFGPRLRDNSRDPEPLLMTKSWYETNQFMLSMVIHTRMKQYKCLTKNSKKASAIYAPFYAGIEVGQHLSMEGGNLTERDEEGVAFIDWLKRKPEWSRLYGWDHFFVAGRIHWDFRRKTDSNNWGSNLLEIAEAKNMTMLTIESSPYDNNDFAIPYPSYFHPSRDSEVLEWQRRVRRASRDYLFTFGGKPRPKMNWTIRGELIDQCKNSSFCNWVSCLPSDEMCNKPAHLIKMFLKSDFCLQPPGDSHTRRSTFDSILAGCIPVFFHPGSAYTQYVWHFPKNYTKYSVLISFDGVKNGTISVEKVLSEIQRDVVLAMKEEVIKLIPTTLYARNKLKTMDDAFDVAIKGLLERIDDARREIRAGKDPNNLFPEYASWKYYFTGNVEQHEWDSSFRTGNRAAYLAAHITQIDYVTRVWLYGGPDVVLDAAGHDFVAAFE